MKKYLSVFAGLLVALGAVNANAASDWEVNVKSSGDFPGDVSYERYQTRTVTRSYGDEDVSYAGTRNRNMNYDQYEKADYSQVARNVRRKYFLAHPFYQPAKGMFGSHTDLSYATNSYDFDIRFNESASVPLGGNWEMSGFTIKEDFSYGITDTIAIMGMLQYDINEYKFEWDDNSPDDKFDDDGLNIFGIGGQWRFADNAEWIAEVAAYFQHQKDISNNFTIEVKGGYKVSRSTIYGLARGWYLDLDGDSYGNAVEGDDADGFYQLMYIPYQTGTDSATFFEVGMGVFSVLNEDWTLNVEAVFGNYDWHNQGSIKGAIGWQPNDWFALNLYAKAALFDSADGKEKDVWFMTTNPDDSEYSELTNIGTAKLDNYAETRVGLQLMFQF